MIHSDELALATAAASGAPGAIAELERRHHGTIDAVCRRFASPVQSADDLRQILRERLFVAAPGARPKVADYRGDGALDGWLRVTAVRLFLDLAKRKDRAREEAASDEALAALAAPGDLALDLVKAEYRTAVADAMRAAAAGLASGDRHLLRQHLALGLSIDQLAPVLGLHGATVARRIAQAREQLARDTRRFVAERLALPPGELDDVLGLVMSRLDLSLGKLLATRAGGAGGAGDA